MELFEAPVDCPPVILLLLQASERWRVEDHVRLWRQVLNMYIGLFARLCNPILLLSKSLQQPALASPSPPTVDLYFRICSLIFSVHKIQSFIWSWRTFQINYSSHTAHCSPRLQGCGLVCCVLWTYTQYNKSVNLPLPFIGKSPKMKYDFFASSLRTAEIGANENTQLASVVWHSM